MTGRGGASFQGRLIAALLPLTGRKRGFRNEAALRKRIAAARRKSPPSAPSSLPQGFTCEETVQHGLRVFVVQPSTPRTSTTILYLHGGAFVFELIPPHWRIITGLAARTGARVVVPLYLLAPEHDWSHASSAVRAIYASLLERSSDKIVLAGDSAGAGLALSLAQRLRDEQGKIPAGLLLFCPWLDASLSDPEIAAIAKRDPMLDVPGLLAAAKMWATGLPLDDARISPLSGSLENLPPISVFAGTRDLLARDSIRLADMSGPELSLHIYPHMFHVWMALPIPESEQALDQAAAFVGSVTQAP
jgi:monoterpene epsilon-lactone hydrolase